MSSWLHHSHIGKAAQEPQEEKETMRKMLGLLRCCLAVWCDTLALVIPDALFHI